MVFFWKVMIVIEHKTCLSLILGCAELKFHALTSTVPTLYAKYPTINASVTFHEINYRHMHMKGNALEKWATGASQWILIDGFKAPEDLNTLEVLNHELFLLLIKIC